MNILFVCSGNVGRSQMAEALFNRASNGIYNVLSAGTDVHEREGQRLDELPVAGEVLDALAEIDIDARANVRKQITEKMVRNANVIVSMAPREEMPAYLIHHPDLITWEVNDPFNQSLDYTREVRDQIDTLVRALLKDLS